MTVTNLDNLVNEWKAFSEYLNQKLDNLALSKASRKNAFLRRNKVVAHFLRKLFADHYHTPLEITYITPTGGREICYGITINNFNLLLNGIFETKNLRLALNASMIFPNQWRACNEVDCSDKPAAIVVEAMWLEFKTQRKIRDIHVFSFFFGKYLFKENETKPKSINYSPFAKKALKAHRLLTPLVDLAKSKSFQDRLNVGFNLSKLFNGVKETNALYDVLDPFSDFLPVREKNCERLFDVLTSAGVKFHVLASFEDYWVDIKIETEHGNFYI